MKIKVAEAEGQVLDWMVANAEEVDFDIASDGYTYKPSSSWAQGGPILDREHISINTWLADWLASSNRATSEGPTPLIAAMRCYVLSMLGEEVDVPDELMGGV